MSVTDQAAQTFEVHDRQRRIQFQGWRLARATSFSEDKDRWTDLELYRSLAGKYILAGIGQSTRPDDLTKYWAVVNDDPNVIVSQLTRTDDRGTTYMPEINKRVLLQASEADDALRQACVLPTQLVD